MQPGIRTILSWFAALIVAFAPPSSDQVNSVETFEDAKVAHVSQAETATVGVMFSRDTSLLSNRRMECSDFNLVLPTSSSFATSFTSSTAREVFDLTEVAPSQGQQCFFSLRLTV